MPPASAPGPRRRRVAPAAWSEDDAVDTVRLFARPMPAPRRPSLCAAGHAREWARVLAQIIKTPGCGRFLPAASVSVQHPADDRLRGLVLTTTLQRDTAHIAQLVVDPRIPPPGLARALVDDASRRAGAAGCWRVTLLVADDEHVGPRSTPGSASSRSRAFPLRDAAGAQPAARTTPLARWRSRKRRSLRRNHERPIPAPAANSQPPGRSG